MTTRLLFVCMGNLCRSPMAQAVLPQHARDMRIDVPVVDSAGTIGSHAGEPPDPRGRAALQRRGYAPPRHRARRIAAKDFVRQDLILAMDRQNLAALRDLCPDEHAHKLQLFLDFAPGFEGQDMPDPYYGDAAGFDRVLDLCEAGARGLVEALRSGRLTPAGGG